jgi:hypothetical protein
MPFLSAGKSYVAADSLEKWWSRKLLSLNGEGDREVLLTEIKVNSRSVCIYIKIIFY